MGRLRVFALVVYHLALGCLFSSGAAAAPIATKDAEATSSPARSTLRFAVVVGNNKSLGGRRPDLHYADDDAARYFEILQTLAPGRVFLLSEFDRDTQRLFPATTPHAARPTRAALQGIAKQLSAQVTAATALGYDTEVYFVFAGHGDVAQGQGFIELVDERFSSRDLEQWLRSIPFTRGHVILDSCNSFFMLGVRKPGGRHFATSEDATRAMSERLPNVGVFLSTSAEGEAFEWSEIQSGIFSHVVRSGILGGADANGDGAVSYLELSAFVDTATSEVPNPNMRPHVFFRGPGALSHEPIVQLQSMQGVRRFQLNDARSQRLRLRDKSGLPLLDVHAEGALALVLPQAWAHGATVERSLNRSKGAARYAAPQLLTVPPGPKPVTLANLRATHVRSSARGPAQTFEQLFIQPFGPQALAQYVQRRRARPRPVFGVSRQDTRRMQLVLDRLAKAQRSRRIVDSVGSVGLGVLLSTAGVQLLFDQGNSPFTRWGLGGGLSAMGLSALIGGAGGLWRPSIGEQTAQQFRASLEAGEDAVQAFVLADKRLQEVARTAEEERMGMRIFGGLVLTLATGGLVWNELGTEDADDRSSRRLFSVGGLMIGGLMVAESLTGDTPSETLADIWRDDPSLNQYRPTLSVGEDSAVLGIEGTW